MYKSFFLFGVVFLFGSASSVSMSSEDLLWRSMHITNERGLSNSAVNSIYRDSDGFMWFGTWDGLNQYDGKNIKTFYPDLFDKKAISNNIIRKMLEDHEGRLWIITEQGVNQYSKDQQQFTSWFADLPGISFREQSIRACIGYDGNLWASVYGMGLFRFNPEKGSFDLVEIPEINSNILQRIHDFYFHENRLFIIDTNNLISYDFLSGTHNEFDISQLFNAAGSENFDASWFYTLHHKPGLIISLGNGGIVSLNLLSFDAEFIKKGEKDFHVTSVHTSVNDNFLWAGTDNGELYKLNPHKQNQLISLTHLIPELAEKRVKIWSILETSDNILWIGTDGEGVYRTIMKPKPFFTITKGESVNKQLNHQIVRAILEDEQGGLWVGTRGNGLNFIPSDNAGTKYYTTENGLSNNAVLSLEKDNWGNLWIGHDGNGIDLLDFSTGKIHHFPEELVGGEQLEFGSVYDICVDAFGQIWLGTSGFGVIGLNIKKENNKFILVDYMHIQGDGPDDKLKSNIIYAIKEEKPNILWIATRGAGIYRLNTLTSQLENYNLAQNGKPGLNNNDVLSMHMADDGYLWVGTSGGLNRVNINFSPYEFSHYTTGDGLPNNTIHAILEDPDGNIWVSTNKGLSKFDRKNNHFVNFNSDDGLQNNEYTDGAAFHSTESKRFFFGGINGIDWFNPEEINVSKQMPVLIFKGFRLFNSTILPGDSTHILSKNVNELERISLKHNQNFFTIEFTTLNFINPDKSLFEYKLENFTTDWVQAGNQREANFTNVPYGKYKLMVRATNEDGVWSDEIKTLDIIIHPPFWKTWVAYLIYLLIASAIGFWIYKHQTRRIKRKQQRTLEKIKQDKEKELNQYKLQFFTNLAHEFGTPLTLIFASAASLMNQKVNREESSKLIKTVYQNSRRMQRLVQELLEFRKIESSRERVKSHNTEMVSTLNNLVEIFSHFARENELEISFEPILNELWVVTDSSKLEKIVLNLLSNAVKYTPAGGNITVTLETNEDQIIITVDDTGIGIPDSSIPFIFDSFYQYGKNQHPEKSTFKGTGIGLAYTKSLVELLGGKISVKSRKDKGTSFRVQLPCSSIHNGQKTEDHPSGFVNHSVVLETLSEENSLDNNHRNSLKVKPALWTTPKKYRILVAEDDPELSNLLFRLLTEQYDVNLVKNGDQALEVIKQNRIDLLVSDIIMPGMDGLTLCKTIKTDIATSHIPIILLTAKSEIENRIEGLEMGADSYIPKPFHPKHLFVRIEKLLKTREQISDYFKNNFGTPAYDLQQNYSMRDKELLEKCIAFIENNFARENLDAESLASHLALSKAQLYRKIKALTGLTPHGLIKNFRLKKAHQMIAEGKYSITEIIYMTGFNNRTYFYRSYKEVFAETPGEMNKKN
ncbi:MAG: two-component regulator propeller domain-containing protein [Bacteroidota bacterium]